MDIQDALEKWLYANVGAAALVSEHMKKTVDTLVAKGQNRYIYCRCPAPSRLGEEYTFPC